METKSPVPSPSLPQPGESAQGMMEDIWFDRVMVPALVSACLGMAATMEWMNIAFKTSPWFWTVLFCLSVAFTAWRYKSMRLEIGRRQQGIRGERIVGQLLEDLRSLGCKVYHDVVEDGYNIDHVIIGPHGVFAVETKALSKPRRGQSIVRFDGETVTVGGYQPDRDPVVQANASARRIRHILRERTGQEPRVTPVLLYVGWFVETYARDTSVIVMNQDYFYKSFDRLQDCNTLSADQVDFFAAGMELYLRDKRK